THHARIPAAPICLGDEQTLERCGVIRYTSDRRPVYPGLGSSMCTCLCRLLAQAFRRSYFGPVLGLALVLILPSARAAGQAADATAFFEKEVRPLLVQKCQRCHGPKKQESGLRLDSRAALLRGGDGGPVVVPGEPDRSRLLAAVRHQGDLHMPPDSKLRDHE